MKQSIIGAGKFDIVFDNNARKLADVEPLVEAIVATGGCEQFIFMSSAGVYGPTDLLPLDESTPGDPNSRHKEKLSCENYLDSQGFNWTSVRPVYIYGPLNYNPAGRASSSTEWRAAGPSACPSAASSSRSSVIAKTWQTSWLPASGTPTCPSRPTTSPARST